MNTHSDGGHKEHKLSGNTTEKEQSSAWPAKGAFLEKEESAFHAWGVGGEGRGSPRKAGPFPCLL